MKNILILGVIFLAPVCFGQGARWDLGGPVAGVSTYVNQPSPGGQNANYLVTFGPVTLNWCNYPANSIQGTPCTNFATTYTDLTLANPCPSNQPIVLQNSTTCQSLSDALGNLGVYSSNGTYTYTITSGSRTFGPYVVTLGAGSGSPLSVNGSLVSNPDFIDSGSVTFGVSGSNISATAAGGGATNPGAPVNSVQGNCATAFCGIQGLSFGNWTGANPSNIKADQVNSVVTVTPDYNFTACASGCKSVITGAATLISGSNTLTLTPCPVGVAGADTLHYLWITPNGGDTSPQSPILISGGTCTSGASSGTVIFTAYFPYIAGYTLGSATQGIQEAWNTFTTHGATLLMQPQATYTINAPVSFGIQNDMTINCQGALIYDDSFQSGFIVGGGSFGNPGLAESANVENCDFRPNTVPWSITLTGAVAGGATTATITATTCPAGFYAAVPGQLLWLNGNGNGIPSTIYGTGEFVETTTGGTCTPGASGGTIVVTQVTPGAPSGFLAPHDIGSSLSSNVGAYIEDGLAVNGHFHDLRFGSNTMTTFQGNRIQIDNDQACEIDNIDASNGYSVRNDIDFQGASVFAPGGGLEGICKIHNLNQSSGAYCVNWWSGNDLNFDEGICQNFSAAGVMIGRKRGGFGHFSLGQLVHFEQGGITPNWGATIGIPSVMVIGGGTLSNASDYLTGGGTVYSTGNFAQIPIYANIGGATSTQFYYAVAHNTTGTGCGSGGDCVSAPVLLGVGIDNDPSVNPVTLNWYGWGLGPYVTNQAVSSYDIIAQTVATNNPLGASYTPSPSGTSTYLVASGLLPSSICSVKNLCTYTDTLAPGSRTSYTVNANDNKTFAPLALLMAGTVGITGSGGSGSVASSRYYGYYAGNSTCLTTMKPVFDYESKANGTIYGAEFTTHAAFLCAGAPSPIAFLGGGPVYSASSGSGGSPANTAHFLWSTSGATTISAGQTTITIDDYPIQPWTRVAVTENAGEGSNLGVTCNTTPGRTYLVTSLIPGVSVTITASAAPSSTAACLDVKFDN